MSDVRLALSHAGQSLKCLSKPSGTLPNVQDWSPATLMQPGPAQWEQASVHR